MPEYGTTINIDTKARDELVKLLNQHIADAFDLYSQTKQAHWNVVGENFFALHGLFDTLADVVLPFVDAMAERVTALGGIAEGTARMAAANSQLPEFPHKLESGSQALTLLIERFGMFANSLRDAIDAADAAGDMASSDLFTEIVREMDKSLYFLEQHCRGSK